MSIAKVLLVDDEKAFVEAMTRRLVKRDVAIEAAYDGQEALAKLARDSGIEVVILDVKMPGMDGIETLAEIRRQFPLVETIMLTGHATVESAIEGMKRGAFDYLMKPCDIDALLAKVSEAAAVKRRREEKIVAARVQEITSRRP
ncbi:MAG TPA: response regulator [Desulfobacteraceae bacterium]|nr:response regulator [Deltaproteobacteria bacterium]MBW2355929.1 response regulator [Deltaproteobacteria bacterium]RLB98490.1 MAG: response regulator [Deltaproteobacteria bacterium]HDI59789.1 response regulator [Desulfobacteraceae bacterium]